MVAMAFTENDQPRHEDSTTTTSAALSYVKGLPMSHARSCTVFRQSTALLIAAIALGAGAAGARAADISTSFTDPGSHTFTVPPGATWVDITAVGAAGGPCGQAHGGSGASVEATVPVVPGEVLSVGVGSPGAAGCGQSNGAGGAGGGANGGKGGANGGNGGGGGGASSVTVDQSASEIHNQPLVIAAGGGGASLTRSGGDAEAAGEAGGQPGSVTAGGTGGGGNVAGQEFIIGQSGSPGSLGAGGAGGDGYADPGAPGGGGGGGGYYGGGGGGGGAATPSGGGIVVSGGGGGGGSNYVTPARTDVGTSLADCPLTPRDRGVPHAFANSERNLAQLPRADAGHLERRGSADTEQQRHAADRLGHLACRPRAGGLPDRQPLQRAGRCGPQLSDRGALRPAATGREVRDTDGQEQRTDRTAGGVTLGHGSPTIDRPGSRAVAGRWVRAVRGHDADRPGCSGRPVHHPPSFGHPRSERTDRADHVCDGEPQGESRWAPRPDLTAGVHRQIGLERWDCAGHGLRDAGGRLA